MGAHADLIVYTSSTANPVTANDGTESVGFKDASFLLSSPNTAFGSIPDVQATGENVFPLAGPTYAVISLENLFTSGFGSLIGSSNDIYGATLWVYQNVNGAGTGTLTIRGLIPDVADWNEAAASWNNKDATGTGWDGAGGTIQSTLNTETYGTATYDEANEDSWVSIDITDALKAYKEGEIGGIVLTSDGIHNDNRFSFDSAENLSGNGLVIAVDQIPEPAVVSFLGIGATAFYIARKWHAKTEALYAEV
jgi:hypothetical protein